MDELTNIMLLAILERRIQRGLESGETIDELVEFFTPTGKKELFFTLRVASRVKQMIDRQDTHWKDE